MLRGSTSYIIVGPVMSFPYAPLSETTLNFGRLALKDISNSLNDVQQMGTQIGLPLSNRWCFIAVIFVVTRVMTLLSADEDLRGIAISYSEAVK